MPDRASSEGRAIRQVELLSNKLLTIAFEVSLGCVTVIRRASVDSEIVGIAIEHRNTNKSERRLCGLRGRQYVGLSLR